MKDKLFHARTLLLARLAHIAVFAMAGVGSIQAQGQAPPNYICGVFQKLGGIPDGYGGQVYYDRFGNTWSEDEIVALGENVQEDCDAGVFKLSFSGNYTVDERLQICNALTYLSDIVGGGAPGGVVPLKIEFLSNVNGAKASSFMQLECGMMKNYSLINIRTAANQLPLNFFAGKIEVDEGINWHTGAMPIDIADWNTNYAGKVDLYTAVLHEGLHILGMASTFGGVQLQGGGVGEGYTDWDRHLYDRNGTNYIKLIEPAPAPDCCSKQAKNPNAPSEFPGDCNVDIMFRDGAQMLDIAEVSRNGQNNNDISGTNNRLSHLDIACGAEQYVMHPGIPTSPALHSFPRRVLTQAELDILCRIGYPAAGNCQNCVVVAEGDVIEEVIFLTGSNANNPISRPLFPPFQNALLGNDVYPNGNVSFEICGHGAGIDVEYQVASNDVEITGLVPGSWEFCYRIISCDGVCEEATVHVTVLDHPIPTGCVSDDCNLVCFGDFEGFPVQGSVYYSSLDLPEFYFGDISNTMRNTPDIHLQTDVSPQNKVIRWVRSTNMNQDQESVRIPLSEPIYEGCTATISYQAAAAKLASVISPVSSLRIELYGLTAPPCTETPTVPVWSGVGISNLLCNGVTAFGIDQNTGLPFDVDVNGDLSNTLNLDLEDFSITYTHPIGASPITDLLFWGTFTAADPEPPQGEGLEFYMDNVVVTSSCNNQINITPTVLSQCIGGQAVLQYEVCLLGSGSAPVDVNLQAAIPFGLTVVPGGGFDANGLASFQLVPGTECNGGANTTTLTLTMNVSPNFDPAQAPIPVDILMDLIGNGLCIDPAIGEGGDVTLMLQDCSVPTAACHCPPNTGYEVGVNMDSYTELSMSSLPVVLENTCLAVSGRLVVDENFSIANCQVVMNRGAEIVVSYKAKLEITDFSVLEGCEHMWRGITVENGGELSITNGTNVMDAQWAVKALNGSIIEIKDSYFDACYAGIHTPASPAAQTINIVAIKGNEFACTNNLKPAYTVLGNNDHQQIPTPGQYTYAGIAINDVASFDISENNKFEEIRNGVFAVRSGFTMERCTIRNLITDPLDLNTEFNYNVDQHGVYATDCPLAKMTYCDFLNFGKGIFSERSNLTADLNTMTGYALDTPADDIGIECSLNTNRSVRIRANTITMWGTGIRVTNALPASIFRVKNNTIAMRPGSFGPHIDLQSIRGGLVSGNILTRDHNTALGIGISMLTCSSITVQSNNMLDIEYGTSTSGCTGNVFAVNDAVNGGLKGYSAFNSTDTYCSNKSQDQSDFGFYFWGMCIKNNALRCNNINNAADDGLNLWANLNNVTKIGTQINGGNKWLGMYGGWGAYNSAATNAQDILDSQFRIPANQIPTWSTGLGQSVAWFLGVPVTPPNCLVACPLVVDTDEDEYPTGGEGGGYGGQGDLDNADITTAQNGHYGAGFNWMARQRLYERLRLYPALAAQNPYVQQFYNAAPYTDLGQLYEVGKSLVLLQGRNEYIWGAIRDLQKEIAVKGDALQALRATGPGNNYEDWWLQIRLLQQDIKQAVNQLRGHENWLEGLRQAELPAILSANTGVTTNNICALNQRSINHIYASNSLWKPNGLSAPTLLQVKAIADQCPLDGGFAVYEARGLYRRFVPTATWSENAGCGYLRPGPRDEKEDASGALTFAIMPNPADEVLHIVPNIEMSEEAHLEIFGLLGQRVWASTLPIGFSGVSVPTSSIPSGVYLCRISLNGETLQHNKILISH